MTRSALASSAMGVSWSVFSQQGRVEELADLDRVFYEDLAATPAQIHRSIEYLTTAPPNSQVYVEEFQRRNLPAPKMDLNQYLAKMHDFEASHREDIFVPEEQFQTLIDTFKRLDRVQSLVGHGNFNVVSFDDALRFSQSYSAIGDFKKTEIAFVESIFSADALEYGFFGGRVIDDLTSVVNQRDSVKIGNTGHYLFRGSAERLYNKLHSDLDGKVVLTSGIRNIVKQTHLFLAKTIQSKGNLSRASRSLAPPGHSFHGIGDFDVGKIGFGSKNFTEQFARTAEFSKLVELGYIDMRYPEDNLLGVRYEPWHIKVA